MKQVPLTNSDLVALVSDDDFERVTEHTWYLDRRSNDFAPVARTTKKPHIRMHTFIMQPPEGLEVNHKNFNTLDNQRSNLENITHKENCRKRRKVGYVMKVKGYKSKPYRAWVNGKHIGYFASEQEAWSEVRSAAGAVA